jgi:hypothetical protein
MKAWCIGVVRSPFISGAIIVVGVIGAVFAPVFYTWLGISLRRFEPQETT